MHHGKVSPAIAAGLLALKDRIDAAKIPASKIDETINVAVWNVREFGKKKRLEPSNHYIAEILGQFDLVALLELRDNLEDLGKVMEYLGEYWDIVYSDWIPDAGGNKERAAFLYDRRAVQFCGLAAEIDAPRKKSEAEYLAKESFWRAPYMCAFRSGNFDFIAIATHIRWGDDTAGRAAEIQLLADWIKTRFADKYAEDTDLIVMGDFNTPSLEDELFEALTSGGLKVPKALLNLKSGEMVVKGSNLGKTARYDQILHLPTHKDRFNNVGGIVDFHRDDAFIKKLFPTQGLTRQKFTYELSDHFPVWTQINVDIDGDRLSQIIQAGKK